MLWGLGFGVSRAGTSGHRVALAGEGQVLV